MKRSQIRDLLILAAVALIVFSITILIETALHEFPLRSVIFGSSIFIVIVILLFSLVFLFHRSLFQEEMGTLITSYRGEMERLSESHKKELDDLLAARHREMNSLMSTHCEEVDALIERLQSIIPQIEFDWLLTDQDMAKFEGKVKGQEIWIISPDLELDALGRTFRSVTTKNFEKGIRYTFIVPSSELIQTRISILEGDYKQYSSLIRIKQVPESDFRLLAVTHIDIYAPNTAEARVFLQLPIKQRGYWIELSRDDAHSLIGRFRKIAED